MAIFSRKNEIKVVRKNWQAALVGGIIYQTEKRLIKKYWLKFSDSSNILDPS